MAHLTDMEELLATVISGDVRDYMREAMNCYMSSAYRGCIVLSYIALFDDLLAKLAELGKVNSDARTTYQEAEKKKSDQEVFESYLIDQLGSKNLLSSLDTAFLSTLRTLRNKSAHPSGHKPSPEEARFIYFEVINRFLSRPILSTTQLVDEIIGRLKNKNFFPTSQITDISEVVEEEIESLHNEAYPQLIVKLTKESVASDADTKRNAGFFLTGLAYLDKPEINDLLQKKVIQPKSDDADYHHLILRLVSSNGQLFKGINKASVTRFKNIFIERIDSVKATVSDTQFSHPISVFVSLSKVLSDKEILDIFKEELENLFNRKPYSNYLLDALADLPKTKVEYIETIKKKAGSATFDVANAFASSVGDIDEYLAAITTDEDAFQIVVAVLEAAAWGAFGAQGLEKTKFSKTPNINAKAITYLNGNKRKSKAYIKEKLDIDVKAEKFIDDYFDHEE